MAFEIGGAFFQKGFHALHVIVGFAKQRLGVSFHIQLLIKRARAGVAQQRPRGHQSLGGHVRQTLSQGQ